MRKIFACGAKKIWLATLAGELGAIGSPKNDPLSVVHTRVSQPAVGEPSRTSHGGEPATEGNFRFTTETDTGRRRLHVVHLLRLLRPRTPSIRLLRSPVG